MSKNHRDPRKPVLSDWTVHHADRGQIIITQARFIRDDRGGYAFSDDKGPVADFPPGSVLSVMRKDEPEAIRFMLPPSFGRVSASQAREMQDTLRHCPGLSGLTLVPYDGPKVTAAAMAAAERLESLDSRA